MASLKQLRRKAADAHTQWRKWIRSERRRTTPESKATAHKERAAWSKRYQALLARIRRREQARQRMTTAGKNMLIREEGVRRWAYNDPAGHATFGVGHLLHHGPVTAADRRDWGTPTNPKSMGVVLRVLERDLEAFEQAVRAAAGRRLKAREFDACVSLAFNIGTGGFAGSTVAREIRARRRGWRKRAADAFLLWDTPSMLRPRRERERHLFLYGHH